jgi:hypothetical protein
VKQDAFADRRAEVRHARGEPRRHASAMQRQIGKPRALHRLIVAGIRERTRPIVADTSAVGAGFVRLSSCCKTDSKRLSEQMSDVYEPGIPDPLAEPSEPSEAAVLEHDIR